MLVATAKHLCHIDGAGRGDPYMDGGIVGLGHARFLHAKVGRGPSTV